MIVHDATSRPGATAPSALGFLDRLLDSLPVGVIVLDEAGRVVNFNRYEERLARRARRDVIGRRFFAEVAPCMRVEKLEQTFEEGMRTGRLEVDLEFAFPLPYLEEPRDVHLRLRSFRNDSQLFGCILVEDVSERRALERMRETLSELLVHDLKNPLTAVTANLSFLGDLGTPPGTTAAEFQEAIADAMEASERLHRMVGTLLDVSRLETGDLPTHRRDADLRGLVTAVVEQARAAARGRGVEVLAEVPEAPVRASVDPELMQRAVDNLVDNALRFTPPGKRVVVRAARVDGGVALEGSGVPEALRARIFDKYSTTRDGGARAFNRGLGLTFVQLAARAHGGEVSVECPPAGGTVFQIALPG